MSTLHPPLCCASTLCSRTLSQVVGPIQLEACLSVKGRGLCSSQTRLAAQLTVQVCVGCLHLHIGASHLPLKQMGEVPSKPEQQDFRSSLHDCKFLACTTVKQRKVSPIRSTCVSHNPRVRCYEEIGSSKRRLCLRL